MFLVCYSIDVFINFIAWEKIWRTEGNAENLVFEAKNVFFRLNAKHSYMKTQLYHWKKKYDRNCFTRCFDEISIKVARNWTQYEFQKHSMRSIIHEHNDDYSLAIESAKIKTVLFGY